MQSKKDDRDNSQSLEDIVQVNMNGESSEVSTSAQELGCSSAEEYFLKLHRLYQEGKIDAPEKASAQPDKKETKDPEVVIERKEGDGKVYWGDSAKLMQGMDSESVDLIMTSPPFGLVKKKSYGNEDADDYVDWFRQFADGFKRVLKPHGSLVIDIGGAWKKGYPVRSLYHFDLVTTLCREFGFHLAQEFYWWNPSKLPTPAEWVTIRRIRVKDAVNCVWWLSKTPYPKASNKRVLQPYSDSMNDLLDRQDYNAGSRPSERQISEEGFLKDNGGSIPPNLISLANTNSNSNYQKYCREHDLKAHPARFPSGLPAFFIRMLTDKNDLVFDPFAGSCITGEVAEHMDRRWICCEIEEAYVKGAKGRFLNGEQDLFPQKFESNRKEPYRAYPPFLSILSEENAPLPEDGGQTRSSRKKADEEQKEPEGDEQSEGLFAEDGS